MIFGFDYDTSNENIGIVLNQSGRPIGFCNEKLNEAKRKYSTYDKEFYAIIRALSHWSHYLLTKEFVLYFDHEVLKYLSTQHKLNTRHTKWLELLQTFQFVLKHKSRQLHIVADALSQRYTLSPDRDRKYPHNV